MDNGDDNNRGTIFEFNEVEEFNNQQDETPEKIGHIKSTNTPFFLSFTNEPLYKSSTFATVKDIEAQN